MGNLRVVPLDMLRDSEEKLLVKLRSGDEEQADHTVQMDSVKKAIHEILRS